MGRTPIIIAAVVFGALLATIGFVLYLAETENDCACPCGGTAIQLSQGEE
jgi:hypothetical protein